MKQVQALALCFSRETVTIVENFGLTPTQLQDVKVIVDAIQRHVEGNVNESVERHTFRHRVQQAGEGFDDFLISLRELAKTCNFCSQECTNKNMRDQIIDGLREADAIEQLLKVSKLDLATTISTCWAQEAEKNNNELRSPTLAYGNRQTCMPCEDKSHPKDLLGLAPGVGTSPTMVAISTVQRLTSRVTLARRLAVSPECAGEERHHQLPHHHPIHQTHEPSQ